VPIFISYSHQDKNFVDQLAAQLVRNRVYVWLDRWELHVGDSITSRIEQAITTASALLVILSKASVESAWIKREINSGLVRELEERRVVVLPVLVEDCAIPLFLRDKLYADFRRNFDDGLRTILEATARISNPSTGRIEAPIYHSDWALDWGETDGNVRIRLTIIQQEVDQKFSTLSILDTLLDGAGSEWYRLVADSERAEIANTHAISQVAFALNEPDELRILLNDQFEHVENHRYLTKSGIYDVMVSARRLGLDNGRDVLVGVGGQVQMIAEEMRATTERPPSA
jgi:hypothetical protein